MSEIVISEFMDEAAVAQLRERRATLYDPGLVDRPDALAGALEPARALIVRNRTRVDADLLSAAPELCCVGRLGVGLDNIDLQACKARGVAVFPATGANDTAVAEYVIATALILLRGAYFSSADVAAGVWPRQALIGGEAQGRRLGLVGYGRIARQAAARARALGMTVAAFDPFMPADDVAWAHTERMGDLDGLLATSDVLSLHVPLTPETRHMLDAGALARMRPGAAVINTARGGVVDEQALAEALRSGHLGGAALDVFETEPLAAAAGAVFAGLGNVILTPHIAGVTRESNVRVGLVTSQSVLAHLEAHP